MNINKLLFSEKYFFQKKSDKCLFIFPNIPFWIIAKEGLRDILDFFCNGNTIDSYYKKNNIIDKESHECLLTNLILKKILSPRKSIELEELETKNNKIEHFIFSITNQCNLRCSSCYNSYENEIENELSIDEIKKMVDEVLPFLNYGFSISGGEPFCKKEKLFELLKYLSQKKSNKKIGIVTNGTLITENDAKKLSNIENLTVQVSLDGITSDSHEFNRGEGTFEKTITAISYLKKYNVNVLLGVLLTEKSINEIKQILDYALKLNIQNVRFIEMFWTGLSRDKNMSRPLTNKLIPIYKDLLKENKEYKKLLQKDVVKILLDSLKNPTKRTCCEIKGKSIYIDSDGSVYPCNLLTIESFKYGNIKNNHFSDILKLSTSKNKICKLSVDNFYQCKSCDFKYFCGGGCRGVAYQAYGNINAPLPNCYEKIDSFFSFLWEFAEKDNLYHLLK